MILRARDVTVSFPRPVMIMGIVNATPDSFSDGGRYLEPQAAADRALQLIEEGADIIDLGGESTRPNAQPISEAEELRRVLPVLERLRDKHKSLLSIDTYKPVVAREGILAGAAIINDVYSGQNNPEMMRVVAESGVGYVVMHMQGSPPTMQLDPTYDDVCFEVGDFLERQLSRLSAAGIQRDQLMLDVGIGFGKRREHNLALLAGLKTFERHGRPLVLGVSRKSFLGNSIPPESRLPAALAASCWAVSAGVQVIRTHDVGPTVQAIRLTEEIVQNVAAKA
ncbi:MAG: dihydropteroate synthase [Verrucomicrobiota bacterium]